MGVERDKLSRFSKAVYDEVNQKIDQILSEAQASRQEILEKTNDASLGEAYNTIQNDMKKIVDKYVKKVSQYELKTKRDVLLHREKLAAEVFENVRNRLISFSKSEEYKDYLVKSLKDELSEVDKNHSVTLFLLPGDMKYRDELVKSAGREIKVLESTYAKIGGIVLQDNDSRTLSDHTLDAGLENAREEFNRSASLRLD